MKKNNRKSATKVAKKCSLSVTALLALGIVGSSLQANERGLISTGDLHGKVHPRAQASVLHEMVPHVVLPETIQYNKVARSGRAHPGISTAGDYGMVSPFVATLNGLWIVYDPFLTLSAVASAPSMGRALMLSLTEPSDR